MATFSSIYLNDASVIFATAKETYNRKVPLRRKVHEHATSVRTTEPQRADSDVQYNKDIVRGYLHIRSKGIARLHVNAFEPTFRKAIQYSFMYTVLGAIYD